MNHQDWCSPNNPCHPNPTKDFGYGMQSVPYSDCGEPMGTIARLISHNKSCAYCRPRNFDPRTMGKGW